MLNLNDDAVDSAQCSRSNEQCLCLMIIIHVRTPGKGELSVELAVFYNPLRAAVRTFKPKEEIIIKESTKFDVALLQRDVKRITTQV